MAQALYPICEGVLQVISNESQLKYLFFLNYSDDNKPWNTILAHNVEYAFKSQRMKHLHNLFLLSRNK